MKILLVEDSDLSADVTAHNLALCNGTLNADVIRAKDLPDALAMVCDAEIVVCDLELGETMPEKTLDILTQLRKQRPVVILSGHIDHELITRAGRLGIVYVLKQTCTPKDLEAAIYWQQAAWEEASRRRKIVNRAKNILKPMGAAS